MAEQRTRNEDIHAILAANVKKYRKQAELSQERLSELCGFHRSYVGRLEREPGNPELSTIKALADQLQVTVAELLSSTQRRNR
jgi:transcriptional regulator with XRE-family HTH domain